MTDSTQAFDPAWISQPGDTIVDLLVERGWNQTELARRMDYPDEHNSQLVNGLVVPTQEAASRLGGSSAAARRSGSRGRLHIVRRSAANKRPRLGRNEPTCGMKSPPWN